MISREKLNELDNEKDILDLACKTIVNEILASPEDYSKIHSFEDLEQLLNSGINADKEPYNKDILYRIWEYLPKNIIEGVEYNFATLFGYEPAVANYGSNITLIYDKKTKWEIRFSYIEHYSSACSLYLEDLNSLVTELELMKINLIERK